MAKTNVGIVGAGISGLATACLLSPAKYNVTIIAKAFFPDITSNKAAAFWFPYHIRHDKRGMEWCKQSYDYYKELAKDPLTGISMKQLLKVLRKGVEEEEPLWINFMPRGCCRLLPPEEVTKGFEKIYDIAVPLIETPVFLPWLKDHLEKSGVSFIQKEIGHLNEIKNDYDIIVNCTGLGAGKLCNDKTIIPVRGQVALLSAKEGLPIYLDNEKPLYIVPRKDAIIIGGTYEENVNAAITEPRTISGILKNAYAAMPELKKQKFIGSWAGLRPYRKELRVELDAEGKIIHNYGHGGSGFTLAFGCAKTVLNLVERITW